MANARNTDQIEKAKNPLEYPESGYGNYGGQVRQKVMLGDIIKWMIEEIEKIDSDESIDRGEKTKRIGRLAKRIKTKLYEDRRKAPEDKLKPSSYRRYLTRLRNAVYEQNWRHHSIEETCRRVAKKHPEYTPELHAMAEITDIVPLRLAYKGLKDKIKRDGNEAAYREVKAMKIDHEIMRHLDLPSVTRDQLSDHAAAVLEQRALNTIDISYHWYVTTAAQMLASSAFSHLALGIAMSTGRRAFEVLAQGRFKKAGKFELEFSGQAKQRLGVDYGATYRIYTLVDADIVLDAIARMRSLPECASLQDMDATEVNRRTAKTLNTLTKRTFDDETRVFKDTRAIWARIMFESHFTHDPRWAKKSAEVFWREMLGHEDLETQESYKQFKIHYEEAKPAAAEHKFSSRLEGLKTLDEHPKIKGRAGLERIHEWVKSAIQADPLAKINQRAISVNVGSYRPNIKEYLEIAADALSVPAHAAGAVAEVPAVVAKAKPHMTSHKADDGEWVAVASVNGVEVATFKDPDRMKALREAFTLAEKA
ncbi:protelomerase family protein [Pseudomonas sp. BCRC 81390]|uniref:protelomerase family protein n=1 Tax=Pseudomonas sp. BCRC 81390 TaxID=3054778 RepID=UPI002597D113|nr:protelomerase family protein [Pseudomonas sp. BCRC 81390]MDM3884654.1 protelomerase family protein [Pseudomonas sp. BCRC 81390]